MQDEEKTEDREQIDEHKDPFDLAALKAANPGVPLSALDMPEGTFVVRPMPKGEWARWMDSQGDGRPALRLLRAAIVERCTVWPSRDELKSLLEVYPAISESLFGEIHDLTGAHHEVRRRKL